MQNFEMENEFPMSLARTKTNGGDEKFNLSDAAERKKYFEKKAGAEIKKIKKYLETNSFVTYWLGKKNAGKGTYSKLMMEIFGEDKIGHISVGDVVRDVHGSITDEAKKNELMEYLKKNYRGYISIDEAINALLSRDTKSLLPTEFILALVKKEIDKMPKKTLFIDGFPRELDQVSYSLYFRNLINYRDDLDIFAAIDIPESVIDQRMKYRVVCPKCRTPRSLKFLPTEKIGYDENKKDFYLMCDNPECDGARMVGKEGDELGIETIRERIELDDKLIRKVFSLHGVPKIFLRNAIPVNEANDLVDNYEITPEYVFSLDENKNIVTKEIPWIIKDDNGKDSYSLLSAPVIVSLLKQLANILPE